MADYRVYVRQAAAFNGVTAEAAVYTGQGYKFTTPTTTAVGVFSPTSIGRFNVASLVQVFSDNALNGGDAVNVLSSAGVLRYSAVFGPAGTGWLFLEPDDSITITAAAATKAEIVVNDLNDDQLSRYISASIVASASTLSLAGTPIVSAVNVVLTSTATAGKITPVQMTGGAAQSVTLPLSSSVPVGTQVIVFNSTGNAHTINPTGADLIDGANANFAAAANTKQAVYAAGSTIGWIVIGGA